MKKLRIERIQIAKDLQYFPDSGIFRWKRYMGGRAPQAGEIAGTPHIAGYTQIGYKNNIYLAHRVAWLFIYGSWPQKHIDHINGIKTDNRICNLRECNHAENLLNRPKQKNNKIGHKNIFKEKRSGKYVVKIMKNGKSNLIGYYKDLNHAIEARDNAMVNICGVFART